MKKILISIPIARTIKFLLDTPLYELMKAKYEIVLLLGIGGGDVFEQKYGGGKVKIYQENESGMRATQGRFTKFLLQYNWFHSDFRLSQLSIGKVNLFTKKNFFPGRYKLFKIMYALEKCLGAWPLVNNLIRRQCSEPRIDSIVRKEKPDLVISTIPARNYPEYCLQNAARRNRIPLVFYPASWDDMTRKGEVIFPPQKNTHLGPGDEQARSRFRGIEEGGCRGNRFDSHGNARGNKCKS